MATDANFANYDSQTRYTLVAAGGGQYAVKSVALGTYLTACENPGCQVSFEVDITDVSRYYIKRTGTKGTFLFESVRYNGKAISYSPIAGLTMDSGGKLSSQFREIDQNASFVDKRQVFQFLYFQNPTK